MRITLLRTMSDALYVIVRGAHGEYVGRIVQTSTRSLSTWEGRLTILAEAESGIREPQVGKPVRFPLIGKDGEYFLAVCTNVRSMTSLTREAAQMIPLVNVVLLFAEKKDAAHVSTTAVLAAKR